MSARVVGKREGGCAWVVLKKTKIVLKVGGCVQFIPRGGRQSKL